MVEIAGLAPGRQVRCGFCDRLLEAPYLPRVPGPTWKRRRFAPSRCARWAWYAAGAVATVAVIVAGVRLARRQYRSAQDGAIHRLLASSHDHETAGRLDRALIDLDTALELTRRTGRPGDFPLDDERNRRADLARREARAILEQLASDRSRTYLLGEWLGLIARTRKDPDLSTLGPKVREAFHRSLRDRAATELEAARRGLDADRAPAALEACERVARLLPHLPPEAQVAVRRQAEALVTRLVEARGVVVEMPEGDFVFGGQEAYRDRLLPRLVKGLESKGYLPDRQASPWRSSWRKAKYHLRLRVTERLVGNYLSSENRLSRIEAHLLLGAPGAVVWETRPTVQTAVPLPGLPAYLSGRLAASPARIEEFERLLYENARGQLDARFGQALTFMPACCPG